MRAADVIVKCLEAHGISRVYCVPGESFLALLDALYGSSIQVIICRHESGAGFMAIAEARLTGKPAVFLVSRGPGATNGSIAVHVAEQDATPVLLFIGQVSREEKYRGAFQEVDYGQFFGGMAKAVYEVSEASKMGEIVTRSLRLTVEGTPGPVVISLPEDVLRDEADDHVPTPFPLPVVHHSQSDIGIIQTMIEQAETPLLIAGALFRGAKGSAALEKFAEALRIPVAVTWKNQDIFDNGSPLYAGHLGFGNPPKHREVLARPILSLRLVRAWVMWQV
jgi:acetolactate synthase I/II/III large subunit